MRLAAQRALCRPDCLRPGKPNNLPPRSLLPNAKERKGAGENWENILSARPPGPPARQMRAFRENPVSESEAESEASEESSASEGERAQHGKLAAGAAWEAGGQAGRQQAAHLCRRCCVVGERAAARRQSGVNGVRMRGPRAAGGVPRSRRCCTSGTVCAGISVALQRREQQGTWEEGDEPAGAP